MAEVEAAARLSRYTALEVVIVRGDRVGTVPLHFMLLHLGFTDVHDLEAWCAELLLAEARQLLVAFSKGAELAVLGLPESPLVLLVAHPAVTVAAMLSLNSLVKLQALTYSIFAQATNEAAHGRYLRLERLNLAVLHFLCEAFGLEPQRAPVLPLLVAIDEVTLSLLALLPI